MLGDFCSFEAYSVYAIYRSSSLIEYNSTFCFPKSIVNLVCKISLLIVGVGLYYDIVKKHRVSARSSKVLSIHLCHREVPTFTPNFGLFTLYRPLCELNVYISELSLSIFIRRYVLLTSRVQKYIPPFSFEVIFFIYRYILGILFSYWTRTVRWCIETMLCITSRLIRLHLI